MRAMTEHAPRYDYAAMFDDPAAVFADPSAIEIVRMPALHVSTGELVGFDPHQIGCYDLDYAPYERTVAPGLYAGRACVDRGSGGVAATWLQLRRAAVVRWALAAPSAAALDDLTLHVKGTAYGYECRGTGGLADAHALAPYVRRPERLLHKLERARSADTPYSAVLLSDAGPNLWVTNAHDGGPCRAFWGLDSEGQTVALVSDFFTGYHAARPRPLT